MSAGNSPPNPGAPRTNPHARNASIFARRGPLIIATVAVGGAAYLFASRRPPQPQGTPSSTVGTTGVGNIEKAYTNAGATSTHTKAYGGTPMGQKDNEELREHSPAGAGTPKGIKGDGYGDDQRASEKTKVEKIFNKSMLGDEKGK